MENIVLSTRIRLARNFVKFPFVSKMTEENAREIIKATEETILSANEKSEGYFRVISPEELKSEGGILRETHLISPDILASSLPSSVIISKNKDISIMINEEDHLRIQVIKEGFSLKDAYSLANTCDNLIEEKNDYAFSEKYGYLTSCPTNAGTGMRASVMLHLPAITMTGGMNKLTETVNRLGITVRGYYGEGSKAYGNLYQFSNRESMGISEEEIINKLENIVSQVVENEKKLRERILNDTVKDKIMRSYGILKNCFIISFEEFCSLWSNVLLGIDLGIIETIDRKSFKNLIVKVAPATLNCEIPHERDRMRAEILRKEV